MNQTAQKIGKRDMGLRVGPLGLGSRAFLAPMAGISDLGMRRIAQRFGAGLVISEMVAAEDFARGEVESRIRAEGVGLQIHAVQIAGCEPRSMAEAARLAEASGAALVDINMGCPSKRVTGGFAGSALMRDLDQAVALVRATLSAVKIPVTLKMRLGWDERSINAAELARRAEAEGIAMLTVHGRTRCQFFTGKADWQAIRTVKESVSIPVVANGDCGSLEDAGAMLAASGADAVMIGRAALGRPGFVGEVAGFISQGSARGVPSIELRLAAMLEHYETLLDLFGKGQGLRHARKHLAAFAKHADARDASHLRKRLVTSENPEEVKSMLADLFAGSPRAEAA